MLKGKSYHEMYENFHWDIPEKLNIGVEICDKWAQDKFRIALIHVDRDSRVNKYSYWELKNLSNRLANSLVELGVVREDRVAVFLPNTPETLVSHIAIYKTGAILVPLLTLFGPMAIEYRLQSSAAKVLITDRENLPGVLEVRQSLPDLETLIVVDGHQLEDPQTDIIDFWSTLEKHDRDFEVVDTGSEDPALIIYTSGTTGPPKGALHGHKLLPAEVSNLGFNLNLFPQPGDLLWTHCDWAYVAGSFTALYPTLNNGLSVVNYARTGRFDPDEAFRIISEHGVTVIFAIASALRIMMENVEHPSAKYDLSELRSIAVGGETMGHDLLEWGRKELGVELNENYGLTECDYSICNCTAVMEIREGSMGRAIPGHVVEIIDDEGNILPSGTYGQIAIRKPNPSIFMGYWNDPEATMARFTGDWLCTGDYAIKDADGYFWFTGRQDDIIESGGYRIGPGEIEAALKRHASVADAAVIGIADALKGQVVKAFVTVKAGVVADKQLEDELSAHVRNKLEAHAYPRQIEFLHELPVGNTGKVMKQELRRMEREKLKQNHKG
ncbi:MAG: AMP-binding protein [Gammaproteobacteria bacterium]|nr:AMP-binding protein [Gammaproteobacteria bacterium]